MTGKKITVGIIFGGQSAEHEVSLNSAQALYVNLDREKYHPVFIYISRDDGLWRRISEESFTKKDFHGTPGFSFLPWTYSGSDTFDADIYFPMLHGPNGEDGRIPALLELAGKPYAGANSTASALAMDKAISKVMFRDAGLNVGKYLLFQRKDHPHIKDSIARELEYPVFIKPNSMGSSVGITRVESEDLLKPALDLAFRYDHKVLVEQGMEIRELEVSVMGNDELMVSRPGELIPHNSFYDYDDKYIDGKTTFHIPARLEPDIEEEVRKTAGLAFQSLFLNGMSRVDLFIEKHTGEIYINEINTIPGFTEISMFPKLWALQGIDFTNLITRLIDYGFEYHKKQNISTDKRRTAGH